jgi:hypothetical protein
MTASRFAVDLVCVAAALAMTGCGSPAASSATVAPSPTTDAQTRTYFDLVNGFWHDHVIATSGAQQVCVDAVNPPLCKARGEAMLAVQQKFADDLTKIQAPAKFATEDKTIRLDLPVTLADLTAMVAAASANDKRAVQADAGKHISDMQPILEAFDQIDPAVPHV